ncbi:hypothetical protein ACFP81_06140 [Deinococcus lacus]|uniref:Membrane transporter protein n=1 Tax=Deinococcus lacus TaxID=392561 RepID=A0ABW1YEE8_9DEIO
MTWFDALLVTLWAAITALGVLRGVAGLLWGLGMGAVLLLCGALGAGFWPAVALSLLAGAGLSALTGWIRPAPSTAWRSVLNLLAGTVGGLIAGDWPPQRWPWLFPCKVRLTLLAWAAFTLRHAFTQISERRCVVPPWLNSCAPFGRAPAGCAPY